MKASIAFVIVTIACAYFGRRLGWALSKHYLYFTSFVSVIVCSIVWGCLVALLMHGLIVRFQPHWILKWIFGFAQGAYIAVPNFGLIAESTIPDHARPKHELISNAPFVVFIVSSVVFAYFL
jgi:hypothetical protein